MNEIQELRKKIDQINTEILQLIHARFVVTKKIGLIKKRKNLPPRDKKREKTQLNKLLLQAETLGIDPKLIAKIFTLITEKVVEEHKKRTSL